MRQPNGRIASWIVACALAFGFGIALRARAQDAPQQPPSFRSGVTYVRVDATVLDKNGRPVTDLTPRDFEVREAGVVQRIDSFKLINLDGGLNAVAEPPRPIRSDDIEAAEAARDDVRLFAVFLDDYHVKRDSSLWVRQQLTRFIETTVGPSDMIGLMYPLQSIGAIRMSRDHDAIRAALLQFQGRKYNYEPLNDAERRYIFRVPALEVEKIRNRVSFDAIKALILHLGALKEGRKAFILVTEGYANTLPAALIPYYGGLGTPATLAPEPQAAAGRASATPDSATFFDQVDINTDLREITDLANRYNVSIYTVDPRGLATNEFGVDLPAVSPNQDRMFLQMTMDTMRVLAEDSDGRAILNRNDVTTAMKPIVSDASAYYLIGYDSTVARADGRFHPIEVRVKRPGVQVRHRRGYWAWKPEEAKLPSAIAPTSTNRVAAAIGTLAPPSARLIQTWIGGGRGEDGKTRITFVWEPSAATTARTTADRTEKVTLTATAPDGTIYYRGPVSRSGATAAPRSISFDAAPGSLNLRISIENSAGEVLDTETRTIVAKDLTAPDAIANAAFLRARTVAEWQRLTGDGAATPTAAAAFSRSDRLLLRVPVYRSSGHDMPLRASVVTRADQKIADLVPTAQLIADAIQFEVPLAGLSQGEYAVVLTAADDDHVLEIVPFRITP